MSAEPIFNQEELEEKALFSRGVFYLLKETGLFGPLLDQALQNLDDLIAHFQREKKSGVRKS